MALQLSRREVDDLRSSLDRAIYRTIGKSDSSLLSTVSSCLSSGYERRKIIDKISAHIDSKKASKLADKVIALAQELVSSSKSQKRKHESSDRDKDVKRSRHDEKEEKDDKKEEKKNGVEALAVMPDGETVGSKMAVLSADRIKLMMANAQKEIEERKRALLAMKGDSKSGVSAAAATAQQLKVQVQQNSSLAPPSVIKPVLYSKPVGGGLSHEELEKQRKIAELQARIQRKLAGGALTSTAGSGPAPLILDREGRTVDTSGKRVQLTHVAPTLKANIRAKRREEFRAQLSGAASVEGAGAGARWHDERVQARAPVRTRRPLRFHEPGKFTQMGDRLRMKAQLEKLQNEISQIARKTGISSATKLALLASDTLDSDRVPDIEWWDSVILMTPEERQNKRSDPSEASDGRTHSQRVDACHVGGDDIVDNLNELAITNLVEHPQQLRPPTEPLKPTYMPVFLTKKERKKLRRQSRREAWKEEQEKVRLGLEAPPEPKLRISNLMRALGTEAVQDPTAIEAKVREQIAKRQKTHLEANKARALTKDQKREKVDRKIREDTSLGVHVAVYRVKDLFECASAKFKVEANASQLHMTGSVLLHRGCCVVVVEGGPKQHAKYKRLMLHRIKWEEDMVKDAEGNEVPNSCTLVWEGIVKQRAFGDIKFKVMPTEKQAREHFQKHRVEHYWDLAYSGAVLAPSDEP
ncbi:unnamed protein product [Spodoptera exigua]|nr:unnamed protein product [Spodoptera exigua]